MRRLLKQLSTDDTPKLVGLAVLMGLAAGGVVVAYDAVVFSIADTVLIGWLHLDHLLTNRQGFAIDFKSNSIYLPLVVGSGLFLSAWVMQHLFKGIGGHTTDRVIDAFHQQNGLLPLKLAFAVAIASALTVGLGGSVGREAQAGLIGGAVAVSLGTLLGVHKKHRRLILLIGLSAGFSAAFKTPLGAAFIAIEILYRDMSIESEALLYTIVSAVVAYVVAGSVGGWDSEFLLEAGSAFENAGDYMLIMGLGAGMGILAAIIPSTFFSIQHAVQRLPVPRLALAFLGGVVVGTVGLFFPQIIGEGSVLLSKDTLSATPALMLLSVALLKLFTMSVTIGVGGVGGVLSPSLMIGGLCGAAFAKLVGLPLLATSVVGMGTIFAAVARVPIGTLLMVSELTGGYDLLPATALGVAISYLFQFVIAERLRYPSIHQEQPPTIWSSPAHQDQVLSAGIGLLQRGGIELPEGLQLPDLRALLSIGYPVKLGHGDLILFTAEISDNDVVADQTLAQSPFGDGVWLLEIRHGEATEQPQRDSVLRPGDTVVMMTAQGKLADLSNKLTFSAVFKNWLARHEPDMYQRCFATEA